MLVRDRHVVVVGGGIIGLSCAVELLRRGERVTVIERDVIADGASVGNAGIIAPGHVPLPMPGLTRQMMRVLFSKTNPLYIKPRLSRELLAWLWGFRRACSPRQLDVSMRVLSELGRRSVEVFDRLAHEDGIEGEYSRQGRLEVFRTRRGMRSALEAIELAHRFGFQAEEVGPEELRQRDPCFLGECGGAVLFPESGFANPGRFLIELANLVRTRGGEIIERGKVVDLHVRDEVFRGVGLADGRKIEADTLVLASGIWTTRLASQIGIEIPMQAGKGYHIELEGLAALPSTTCVLMETFVAATPINGRLRLAGTIEMSGINDRVMPKRLEMLKIGARKYIEGIDGAEVVGTWNGLRPMTADGLPVVGAAPGVRGVYVATGHAMMGFMLGPGTGRAIADLIVGDDPGIDLSPMRVDRF